MAQFDTYTSPRQLQAQGEHSNGKGSRSDVLLLVSYSSGTSVFLFNVLDV